MAKQPSKQQAPPASEDGAQAHDSQPGERRARHRVDDDQKSGEGSLTALSKLKMIERKLAAIRAMRNDS